MALGDDLEPIVLFDKARPGDKVLVAVKLLHTVDTKTFRGTELKIDFAENRPNPEDLRLEILSAALLIPSISKDATAETATLERAVDAVDLAALDSRDQAKFDAPLKQAQSIMNNLKPGDRGSSCSFGELDLNVAGFPRLLVNPEDQSIFIFGFLERAEYDVFGIRCHIGVLRGLHCPLRMAGSAFLFIRMKFLPCV